MATSTFVVSMLFGQHNIEKTCLRFSQAFTKLKAYSNQRAKQKILSRKNIAKSILLLLASAAVNLLYLTTNRGFIKSMFGVLHIGVRAAHPVGWIFGIVSFVLGTISSFLVVSSVLRGTASPQKKSFWQAFKAARKAGKGVRFAAVTGLGIIALVAVLAVAAAGDILGLKKLFPIPQNQKLLANSVMVVFSVVFNYAMNRTGIFKFFSISDSLQKNQLKLNQPVKAKVFGVN